MLYRAPLLMVETERADDHLKHRKESIDLKTFSNFPIVCCPPIDPLDNIDKNKVIAKVLKAYIKENTLFIEFNTNYSFKENNYINICYSCSYSNNYINFHELAYIFIDNLDINKSVWDFEKRIVPLKLLNLE